jgi:hypothetical protein
MRLIVRLVGCAAAALIFPLSVSAAEPAEWDSAVAAMTTVDSTMQPPMNSATDLIAVGGGRIGGFFEFAVSASVTPNGLRGQMTLISSNGVTTTVSHADVECVAAATTPDGAGVATVIGRLREPVGPFEHLVFFLTDGGPGGLNDGFAEQLDNGFPCVPNAGTMPFDGNVLIQIPPAGQG